MNGRYLRGDLARRGKMGFSLLSNTNLTPHLEDTFKYFEMPQDNQPHQFKITNNAVCGEGTLRTWLDDFTNQNMCL